MHAVFIELPPFERHRSRYFSDRDFRALQITLMRTPGAGDVMRGTGGLRKLRFYDPARATGKRGGLRVIYYWWPAGLQFWLFTVYAKREEQDLSARERQVLKQLLETELAARRQA